MPHDTDGLFYAGVKSLTAATLAPQYIAATHTFPAFDFQGAKQITVAFGVHEFVKTALTGSNNDLVLIARKTGNQNVTIVLADPAANNAALSVSVSTEAITVHLATGPGGAITSTAAQVKAAIEASVAAAALVVVALAPSNDGTGVVTALGSTALAGPTGTTPTLDIKLQSTADDLNFFDIDAAFTQATAAGIEGGTFSGLGTVGQWVATLGGTTPAFAFSLTTVYRP